MKRTLAMLAAILLPFVAMSASYTNSFVRNGVTYVQRGGLTIKDYVVTNVTSSGGSSITTNDVCNIVTNETEVWRFDGDITPGVKYTVKYTYDQDLGWYIHYLYADGVLIESYGGAASAHDDIYFTDGINAYYVRTVNALGLARLSDLPPLTNGLATAASLASLSSQLSQASQDATNYTDSATNELARSFSVPDYANVSNAAMNALSRAEAEAGFTEWAYSGFPDGTTNISASFENGILEVGFNFDGVAFHGEFSGITDETSVEVQCDDYDATTTYTITATRTRLPTMADIPTNTTQLVNGSGYVTDTITNGLASVSSVAAAISNADTTYTRFLISAPTNVNQSVQYINIADENPSVLSVVIPEGTGTKDWLIYVMSQTNVTISLPAATWWMADVAYTNDIAPQTPTALYFSQAADGIYTLGRQEFTEVVLP